MRQCAQYVLGNPSQVALATVAEVAAGAGVQPSAVVRFAQSLGYSGFSDLQDILRKRLTSRATDYRGRLAELRHGKDVSATTLLNDFAETAQISLDRLIREVDPAKLQQAVTLLARARTVHVLGLRRAFPVAAYWHYLFCRLGIPAILIDGVGGMILERARTIAPDDVLLVATFAPYSDEVVTFTRLVCDRGGQTVTVTDTVLSPVATMAAVTLEIGESERGGFRSLSATMCLAMTLAVAVGEARDPASKEAL